MQRRIIRNADTEKMEIRLSRKGFAHVPGIGKKIYTHALNAGSEQGRTGIMEIRYCDKGKFYYEVEGLQYPLKGGDLFITFPGESSNIIIQPEERSIVYWLQLEIPANRNNFLGYTGELAGLLVQSLLMLSSRHFRGRPGMKKSFEEIIQLSRTSLSATDRLQVYHLLQTVLLQVIRCAAAIQTGPDQRIDDVMQYIEQNIHKPVAIEMLASVHNISESHFKSWFKKATGLTPMDYVNQRKIEKAKQLIMENDQLSVAEITYMLNFSSPQYFATVFRKYVHLSPAAYKANIHKTP